MAVWGVKRKGIANSGQGSRKIQRSQRKGWYENLGFKKVGKLGNEQGGMVEEFWKSGD